MVTGIEKFKEHFSGFEGMYSLIGGVACGLLMDDSGLDFRATKNFDIVLIIEAMNAGFGKAFWDFIAEGGYSIKEKNSGEPEFFRFKDPTDKDYPKEIELFSRKSNVLTYSPDDRLTPIHISDEISSLSAILLNDEYYDFLKSGLVLLLGIQVLNYTHIIPFKAKAWLDLKKRKENGESIDRKNVLKHKRDVFRLSQLITENDSVDLPAEIKKDMSEFISGMENDDIDPKSFGINAAKDDILNALRKVYKI